ncbi:MAG: PIN domain-containing protein [Propionibacteriaceae bacterium]|jgi:predicted nucleic acid-binding protein|nr:PIN domain-containing protein [Propionibacteriaceae bacterium]
MTAYLDTSVLVHAILGTDRRAHDWFAATSAQEPLVSSQLLRLEVTRVLRRENLDAADAAEPYLRRIALVSIDDATLAAAAAIPEHLKTLDSIHLATLLRTDPTATLVTHDNLLATVAAAHGVTTFDPLA